MCMKCIWTRRCWRLHSIIVQVFCCDNVAHNIEADYVDLTCAKINLYIFRIHFIYLLLKRAT